MLWRGVCVLSWAETWSKTLDKYWYWGPRSHGTWHKSWSRGSWVSMRGRCRMTGGGHTTRQTRCDPHAQCFPPIRYSCKLSNTIHISLEKLRPDCPLCIDSAPGMSLSRSLSRTMSCGCNAVTHLGQLRLRMGPEMLESHIEPGWHQSVPDSFAEHRHNPRQHLTVFLRPA